MVNGRGVSISHPQPRDPYWHAKQVYLRDDGRTRHGKLVTPDAPVAPVATTSAAPPATPSTAALSPAAVQASTPGGVSDDALPIAPLHLWRDFSGPLVYKPVDVSGAPFPWPLRSERLPSSWRQFASSVTAETHKGDAGDNDTKEKDEEMSGGDEEDDTREAEGRNDNDENASKKK